MPKLPQTRIYATIILLITLSLWLTIPHTAQIRAQDSDTSGDGQLAIVIQSGTIHAGNPLNTVAFSPDGTIFASGGQNGVIALWNRENGAVITVLMGHSAWVSALAFSPDGRTLASGGSDLALHLWDVSSGAAIPIVTMHPHERAITAISFTPDGTVMASGSLDGTIVFRHIPTDTHIGTLQNYGGAVRSLSFSPDGNTIASASQDGTIWLWGLWNQENGVSLSVLRGHTAPVTSVAFHPTGRYLASGSLDNSVRIWDLSADGEQSALLEGHSDTVAAVAFSSDGSVVLSTGLDGTMRLWNLSTEQAMETFTVSDLPLSDLALSPDGELIALSGVDGTLRLWDVQEQSERLAIEVMTIRNADRNSAGGNTTTNVENNPPPVSNAPTTVPPSVVDAPPPIAAVPSNLSGPAISIPTVNISSGISTFPLDGVSWAINPWDRGVGHLQGTGWMDTGNMALGGHSVMPDGRPGIFSGLYGLNVGDPIILLDSNGNELRYVVSEIRTVRFDDVSVVYPTGRRQLTLITCDVPSRDPNTDFYSQRLIVIAHPV